MVSNRQVIFTKEPTGMVVAGEHLQVHESVIDLETPLERDEYLLKTLMVSIDPYMRLRMAGGFNAFKLDKPVNGFTMSVVIKSNNANFKEGDLVLGQYAAVYEEYTKVTRDLSQFYTLCNDSKSTGLPMSSRLSVLGVGGLTAYVGLLKYGHPKANEMLYVSGAASNVGQIAGQIGKILGLRVVGSAGSDEKVQYLKDIGFDDAFNYKTIDLDKGLTKHCPNGIDIYFDNVGGSTIETVIDHSNVGGRIIVCGAISQYNNEKSDGVRNLLKLIPQRITMSGFSVSDSMDMMPEYTEKMTSWLLQGKIQHHETIANGIEKVPEALVDVLTGKNIGKQLVKFDL
ncbi:hypothetical protein BCR43DRAFT_558028 [Syncephalastrum racemosum]|uniref:Enoyl reductase (ER) domain-containing protein n=1 Tax=Syncephalastrum racemosum TaxID=13706 RepID=A0A1X2H8U1_SYNRA|nr:hypothetical protein BCR43DRAFT_558028 [Syncephalastrum racemosum]